jgi:hypothetical protein
MTYWITRYLAFLAGMVLSESGKLFWDQTLGCDGHCALSAKAMIRFHLLVLINSIVVFLVVMTAASITRRLGAIALRWLSGIVPVRGVASGLQDWLVQSRWASFARDSWFVQDCLFVGLYLFAMALLAFSPSSPGYSYSANGHDIIIDGQYTAYGLALAIERYLSHCFEAAIFFVLTRIIDRLIPGLRNR